MKSPHHTWSAAPKKSTPLAAFWRGLLHLLLFVGFMAVMGVLLLLILTAPLEH